MYKKYCCGCGLCESKEMCKLNKNEDGFSVPSNMNEKFNKFCSNVCPSSGKQISFYDANSIWGKYTNVFISYSSNEQIRHNASSGGTITSLCMYLLENKKVDGIIHIGMDKENPLKTKTYCSTTIEELNERCGSRYCDSSPLKDIEKYLCTDKKYAFVGRPCDVDALVNYSKIDDRVENNIIYRISFFCAGVPSDRANNKLLNELGVKEDECVYLKYRGDGWPGYVTAIDKNNKKYRMTYDNAWGKILGRDIRPFCRLCINGIGETADISCGDAWYLDKNKNPIFEESNGRNVTFCRNEKGSKLYNEAVKSGYLVSEDYPNWEDEIKCYQKYQYERRTTLHANMCAMKLCLKKVPKYNKKVIKNYSKLAPEKLKRTRFLGTIKRILEGKIK